MTTIKYSLTAFIALAVLMSAGIAYADEHTNASSTDIGVRAGLLLDITPEEAREHRAEAQARAEAKRAEVRANIDAIPTDVRADIAARHAEIRARIQARHDAFEENAEERREMREERRDEIKENIRERVEARVQLHLDRFTRILDAAIERLYGIVNRITERADLMEEDGVDVSVAREYLDLAVTELVAAEAALTSIEADLEVSLSLETDELTREGLKTLFADTKAAIDGAKGHVRAAHKAIRDAVAALKVAASASAEAEASTTEEDDIQ